VTGAIVWFTGLPASGKSTLARRLAERLRGRGREPLLLDGDDVRGALIPAPGYDEVGRDAFYRTLGNLAGLAAAQGMIVLVAATAHRRAWRDRMRGATPRFVEVHVATPLDECRRRDPKGLYATAPPGTTLPGVGAVYEPPLSPEVVARPGDDEPVLRELVERLG
jgi:adenylylsulfate kinase